MTISNGNLTRLLARRCALSMTKLFSEESPADKQELHKHLCRPSIGECHLRSRHRSPDSTRTDEIGYADPYTTALSG